ncbi:MAP kinase kinase kinase [Aureococcus anophagefferens]|nr:MAP kinase kinase kinase [Aureococcus anophagefferens]
MAPSRGPFKPPKVTSSIEFEAMLENMTESSSDDDEDISLHSTPKPGDSLSPRTAEAGSLLEAAAAASPGRRARAPEPAARLLSPRSPGGDGDDAFSPSPTKSGERAARRRRIEPGTWKIANVIGQGSFGAIYLGLNMNTGELMAVKELPIRRARDVAELRQEIDILATLEHPNIVKYLGAEVKDADDAGGPALYIMLEYVPGGSVRQLLEAFEKFSESVVRIYGNQILKGLAYLHDNAICHRDIKGANILLDEKGLVKLADFGASCNYELDACAKVQAGAGQESDIPNFKAS